jgi:hypothetical protein
MLFPRSKCRQCFLAHHLNHGNLALGVRLGDFRIDSGIIKADFGSVGCEIAKVNFADPSPVDCAQAHRAGFAGGIKVTAPEFETAKFLARLADSQHFSVRRRVVHRRNLIRTFRYDDAFFDDDTAERAAAPGTYILERELNGAGHEGSVAGIDHRLIQNIGEAGISGSAQSFRDWVMFTCKTCTCKISFRTTLQLLDG